MATRAPDRRIRSAGTRLVLLLTLACLPTCDWIAGLGNDAPVATVAIGDRIVEVDDTVVVDLGLHFSDPDGDSLVYAAVSAAPATVTATVRGRMLSLVGVAAGVAAVTVTVRDPEGLSAFQSFEATAPNRAPEALAAIPDGEVYVDDTLAIDAAAYFADPDGDDLEYSATSSDPTRAAVAVSQSAVRVTGMAVGRTTVTVTARDPGGLAAEQSFTATVPNRAPEVADTIADRVVEVDSVATLDLAPYFTDPDRDSLVYAVASSDSARAVATVTGSALTVTGTAKGVATLTVTARDPHGLEAEQAFEVTVPNRAPVSLGAIVGREVYVGDEVEVDVARHFLDPDGDVLDFAAVSSDTARVVVTVSGAVVTVTGVSVGGATVTVTARDPEKLSAELSFGVKVPNRAPVAVGAIADREVYVGDSAGVDVAAYFSEPDGEALEYAVESSSPATVSVAVSGVVVSVVAAVVGSATVTVAARDPHGLEAEQRFEVTVPNRAPVAVGAIPDREVAVDSTVALDIADHFKDPDGEELWYAAASSDEARVVAAVTGSALTVTGVAKGIATVTVTARDPHGLAAEQRFAVTVPNRAPVPVGAITPKVVAAGDSIAVDVEDSFTDPDGDALVYSATSSDPSRATVAVAGAVATVTGVAGGVATVIVVARDPEGLSAEQAFGVTVPNRAPEAVDTIGDLRVEVDRSFSVDASRYFRDPDGDELAYTAASSTTARATVEVSGSSVTVTGEAAGNATVTVTATDPGGLSATQSFGVTVDPPIPSDLVVRSPSAKPRKLGPGETFTLSVVVLNLGAGSASSGTTLRYYRSSDATISSGDTEIGTDRVPQLGPSRSNDELLSVVAPSEFGKYYYGACADAVANESFPDNNCSSAVAVLVAPPNQPPSAVGEIPDRTVPFGDELTVNAEPYFHDPDDDELDYRASSSNPNAATVRVSESRVLVRGREEGSATITVTVTDPGDLSAIQSFEVEVEEVVNRAPTLINHISDLLNIAAGSRYAANLLEVFTDPDQDPLDWTTSSSNTAAVVSEISNDSIIITAVAAGGAIVTVTATDPEGLSATDEFEVTVVTDRFDMDMLFTDDVAHGYREQIRRGRDTWESALAPTELADVAVNRSVSCFGVTANLQTVDDHVVLVDAREMDGDGKVVARATYCYVRSTDGTPVVSAVVFDQADIDTLLAAGRLEDVAIHEFAHGLGFISTYWRSRGMLDEGADPHFKGPLAIAAFDAAGGSTYPDEKVPASSDYSHWRESVFGLEIMSPRLTLSLANPLSAITLQSMADVGYAVDVSVADAYQLPDTTTSGVAPGAPGQVLDMRGDVFEGPVMVIDANGRIVRVDPAPPGSVPPSVPTRTARAGRWERDGPGIWVRSPPRRDP